MLKQALLSGAKVTAKGALFGGAAGLSFIGGVFFVIHMTEDDRPTYRRYKDLKGKK